MKSTVAAALALLLALALGFLYFNARTQRQLRQAELAAARSELERLQSDIDDLKKKQLPDNELARLKSDQGEAAKLRSEAAALKQSLASAQSDIVAAKQASASKSSSTQSKAANPNTDSETTPQLRTFNSKIAARLPAGHGIAIGGWKTSADKRAFAVLQPSSVNAAPGAPQQVQVNAKWIELSNTAAAALQLDALLTAAGNNPTALPPEYLQQFLKAIETTEGAKILASPRVLANAGQEAMVSVTSTIQTPNGPINIGPEIRLTSTPSADNATIDLAIDATLTVNAKDPDSN